MISKIAFISEELCIGCGICVKVCEVSFMVFFILALDRSFFLMLVACLCRNVHLKLFRLLIFRKILIRIRLIVMGQTPLNCTG